MPARSIAAPAAISPRSTALLLASAPFSLPNGVLAPARMTARRVGSDMSRCLSLSWPEVRATEPEREPAHLRVRIPAPAAGGNAAAYLGDNRAHNLLAR